MLDSDGHQVVAPAERAGDDGAPVPLGPPAPASNAGPASTRRPAPAWLQHVPLVALVVAYAEHFSAITVAMLHAYEQPAFDMAIPDQGIWLLSRFHDPFLTVAGRNLFGDHPSFIYLLLVPVYWVFPHTETLLVVQSVLIALGAVPVYLLARYLLRSCAWPPVWRRPTCSTRRCNRPTSNSSTWSASRPRCWLWASMPPSYGGRACSSSASSWCSCARRTRRCTRSLSRCGPSCDGTARWARRLIGASALMAGFDNVILVPALIGYASAHGGRLPFGGFGGTLRAIVRTPGQFWSYITSQDRPWYLWQMGFSTGLVFLAAPEIAAICILQLAVNVVSDFGYQHQILYHYTMPLVPILICGTVYAISRLRTLWWRQVATSLVLLCALWSCILWGASPFSDVKPSIPSANSPTFVSDRQLLSKVPPNAVVSAVEEFVPDLDHRTRVYMWPNPFHQAYYGNPKYDGTDWPFSSQVQYLVLPACISCNQGSSPWVETFDELVPEFKVVARNANYVLYQRKS